jgi:hypothetical protein
MVPQGLNNRQKHPTFSPVPWKLLVPAIVRKAVRTVSSLYFAYENGGINRRQGIESSLCRKGNAVSSKKGALIVLRDMLGLPQGEPEPAEEDTIHWPLTVVQARGVGVAEGVVVEKFDA